MCINWLWTTINVVLQGLVYGVIYFSSGSIDNALMAAAISSAALAGFCYVRVLTEVQNDHYFIGLLLSLSAVLNALLFLPGMLSEYRVVSVLMIIGIAAFAAYLAPKEGRTEAENPSYVLSFLLALPWIGPVIGTVLFYVFVLSLCIVLGMT